MPDDQPKFPNNEARLWWLLGQYDPDALEGFLDVHGKL